MRDTIINLKELTKRLTFKPHVEYNLMGNPIIFFDLYNIENFIVTKDGIKWNITANTNPLITFSSEDKTKSYIKSDNAKFIVQANSIVEGLLINIDLGIYQLENIPQFKGSDTIFTLISDSVDTATIGDSNYLNAIPELKHSIRQCKSYDPKFTIASLKYFSDAYVNHKNEIKDPMSAYYYLLSILKYLQNLK